jgi:hypothetical protein
MTMHETALKPQKLIIWTTGEAHYNGEDRPFPNQYIDDALSQNILYYAYRQPKTVEELAELTGVPAFYIEDRIENLIKREALIRPTKNTIQTDFVIYDDTHLAYSREMSAALAKDLADPFYDCAVKLTQQTIETGIATAGRSFDELLCLFSLLALDESVRHYPPSVYKKPKTRYDGFVWEYQGEVNNLSYEKGLLAVGIFKSSDSSVSHSHAHYAFHFPPFAKQTGVYTDGIWVFRNLLCGEPLTEEQKETAAAMIVSGHLKRLEDGTLSPTMPILPKEQHQVFIENISKTFGDFLPIYQDRIKTYVNGYVRLFPAQVQDAANRTGFHCFVSMFQKIAEVWQEQGKLTIPTGANCDVLLGRN